VADTLEIRFPRTLLILFVLLAAACGGGSGSNNGGGGGSGPASSITITPADPSVAAGSAIQLVATATYPDGSTRDVTSSGVWSTEVPQIATISNTGLLTGQAVGISFVSFSGAGSGNYTEITVTNSYTLTVLHQFRGNPDGGQPSSLMQASDGNFYGGTINGGPNICNGYSSCGILFRVTPQGTKTTIFEFDGGLDGQTPIAPLLEASDGNFYGTTANGGAAGGGGTIFRLTPDGELTTLHSFGVAANDGYNPSGGLLEASDGNFYGVTYEGGVNDCPLLKSTCGTVYRITPHGTYTTLYSFGATPDDGAGPTGALIESSDGNFYGTTISGGENACVFKPNACGTVFRMTLGGDVSIVHSFGAGNADGIAPRNTLVQAGDGSIYGATVAGGEHTDGALFKIAPDGTVSTVYSFGAYRWDAAGPAGPLTVGSDGNFYGVTLSGGNRRGPGGEGGSGAVFMITPEGVSSVLYAFGPTGGYRPVGAVIRTGDGSLYGVTDNSSPEGVGIVFKLSPP